jgi:hypothetical protein
MGKIPQGILGGVSGSVGGVVGTSWKGINVIKTKPLTVANPRTAGQVAQRTKFGNVTKFSSQILATFIKPLWDRFASRQSGYNAFIAENISLFENESPADSDVIVASKGKMSSTSLSSATYVAATGNFECSFADESGEGYKLSDDEIYVFGFKPGNELADGVKSGNIREDGEVSVFLDFGAEAGDTCNFYVAFRRLDGTVVSDSSKVSVVAS